MIMPHATVTESALHSIINHFASLSVNTACSTPTLIGDGDSKTYSAVVDSKPYGDVEE